MATTQKAKIKTMNRELAKAGIYSATFGDAGEVQVDARTAFPDFDELTEVQRGLVFNGLTQKLNDSQACVSARSAVAAMGGVFYASPDGYCFASQNGVEVATQALFSKEDWQALTPSSIFAVVQDSVLYFWYTGNGGGCYGLDLVAKKLTRHDIPATSVCQDAVTDSAFVTSSGNVYQLFAGNRATGRWVSGNVVIQKDAPFAWLQVWGEQDADNPATFKW